MRFIFVTLLIVWTLPVFAGITNDVVHWEFIRSEKITKDNQNNNEFEKYKKAATHGIKDYELLIRPIKEQHIQNAKSKRFVKPAPRAVIFVSFSMPDLSLKQIISDAAKYNIPVVVRGLIDNSFQKTATRVFELVKENNKGGILINPMWFKQYAINAIPACVVKDVVQDENNNDNFDVIYGNLRLERMLEIVAATGEVGSVAQTILNGAHR